jgi:hypothetical protein
MPVNVDGWVRLVAAAPSAKEVAAFTTRYRKLISDPATLETIHVSMEMRLPAIILLSMGRLKYQLHPSESLKGVWLPDEADVEAKTLEMGREIAASIRVTAEAQLANQELYVADGCNGWVAKTTTPISAYATAYIHGSLSEWLDFISSPGAPKVVKAYQDAVMGIIRAEYPMMPTTRR